MAAAPQQLNADGAPGPVAKRGDLPLDLYGALKEKTKRRAPDMAELVNIDPASVGGTCSERPLPPGLLAAAAPPAEGQPPDPRPGFCASSGVDLDALMGTVRGDGCWPVTRGVGAAVEPADRRRLCEENGWPWPVSPARRTRRAHRSSQAQMAQAAARSSSGGYRRRGGGSR